jgi:hypothetical protein
MKKKILNLLAVLIVLFTGVYQANAALLGRSLNLTAPGGFPAWYQDQNGLALQPCLDQTTPGNPCGLLSEPGFIAANPIVFPTNFPSEVFYYMAQSDTFSVGTAGVTADVLLAIEGGFANATTGVLVAPAAPNAVPIVFNRMRVSIDPAQGTVLAAGAYTVTHPFGSETFQCDAGGNNSPCVFTIDLPAANVFDFNGALGIGVPNTMTVFLKQTVPPPAAGFIGDSGSIVTIPVGQVGQVNNSFSVTGPGLTGPTGSTTQFIVTGKSLGLEVTPATSLNFGAATIAAAPIATAPQTQTVTVTNTTADPVLFGTLATAGANAADFTIAAPLAGAFCNGATVAAGASCSFNITFTPVATTTVLAPRAATILLNPTTVQPVPPVTPAIPNPPPVTLSLSGTAQFPLAVTVTGTGLAGNLGNGSVSSAPAGIGSCTTAGGVNCNASFNAGSTVTLTPTAATNPLSLFDGWSGACTNATGNCIVTMDAAKAATATFIRAFTITTSADANGTITAGSIVKQGTSPTLFITPNTGFHFLSLLDNNVSVTAAVVPPTPPATSSSYAINAISTDHAVAAAFAVNNYVLTRTPTVNGTITGPADADHFTTATFTITPAVGFHIDTLTDSGDATASSQSVQPGTLGTSTYTTSTITGPRTITVTFAVGQENITTSVSKGNGTIVANPAAVNFGSNSTITITPAPGYHIETLTDNGTDVKASVTPGSAAGTFTYTINGVVVEHNVVVGLSNVLNLTSSAGANGTLVCPPTAIFNTTPSITVTPKPKFQIRDILANNTALSFTKPVNPGDAVTIALPAVTADSTVNATFMPSGDLNADGSLTVADALKALRIVIGLQVASGDDAVAMDVAPLGTDNRPQGGNGSDVADVLIILKRVVNVITW